MLAPLRPAGAALLAAALTAPLIAAAPAAADPTAADQRAGRDASSWLGRQFVDGTHLQTTYDGNAYDDPGLTLDAVIAFAASKSNRSRATAALTWLSDGTRLAGYLGDGDTESYVGAHAKLVLALQISGRSPYRYGERNVIGELIALQGNHGRFRDTSEWGDYANAFGQSLGTIALQRAGMTARAWRAAGYLATQACADGGVPITFSGATCSGDADATALAVQAFAAAGYTSKARTAANWLRANAVPSDNSNTAGLVAAALETAGGTANTQAAATSRALIRHLQQGCSAPAGRRGAIAFMAGPFDKFAAPRATAQAIVGLAGANLATLTASGSTAGAAPMSC
ncbi:MAG: hypothetical protein V9G19_15485 [Tetrasphaera sp.]